MPSFSGLPRESVKADIRSLEPAAQLQAGIESRYLSSVEGPSGCPKKTLCYASQRLSAQTPKSAKLAKKIWRN